MSFSYNSIQRLKQKVYPAGRNYPRFLPPGESKIILQKHMQQKMIAFQKQLAGSNNFFIVIFFEKIDFFGDLKINVQ